MSALVHRPLTSKSAPRFSRWRHWAAVVGIGALVAAGTVAIQATSQGEPAAAAVPITVTNVASQMASTAAYTNSAANGGVVSTAAADCIRYGANSGATTGYVSNSGGSTGTSPYTNGYSATVSGGSSTAWTGHGRDGGCDLAESWLDLSSQSSIGFQPVAPTNVTSGAIFNLGRMVHVNRPVNSTGTAWFQGDMKVQFNSLNLTYRWQLNETANDCTTVNCSDDHVSFLNQVGSQTFTQNGITYNLVLVGFTAPTGANSTCSATSPSPTLINDFRTVEGQVTYGCLYAVVQQVRPVTVVKQAQTPYGAPASYPTFPFTSTSSLNGSPWAGGFSLTPGSAPADRVTRNYTVGETVTIAETAPAAPWSFASLQCVDGAGANIGAVTGRSVTLTGDLTAATAVAVPITCTYANTYTPRANLTLVKSVTSTGQQAPVALPADWTLTATGEGAVAGQTVSGPGGSSGVTSQSVIGGTYALSEASNDGGTRTGGYQQTGAWTCTNGVTVAGGKITLAHGVSTTCTVRNTYQTGSLAITKTVASPTGGYTLGAAKAFQASYSCTAGSRTTSGVVTVNPSATNGTAGAVQTVSDLPVGATCTVTELSPPTGSTDLADTSYVWGTPVVSSTATIPVGGTATVDITNPVTQNTGSLTIAKVVSPRAGVPAAAYASTRTFAIGYRCTIGATVTAEATVNVAAGSSTTVTGIPSTSSCVLSETAPTGADFADASFRWDGNAFAQPAAIGVGTTVSGTVTNWFTRDLVSLTIAKTVTGAGYTAGDTFLIDYRCGTTTGTVTLAGGARQAVQVPAGVACSVIEQSARPALTGGNVWADPAYAGLTNGTVTIPRDGTATVTVTNPTMIGYGRIAVAKSIPDFANAVTPGTEFPITVSCDQPERGATANYTGTFTFTAPIVGPQTTPYLPVGASCTVVETGQPTGSAELTDASYAWGEPTYAGLADGAVTIPANAVSAPVTVTNPITRVYGALAINKVVNNETGVTPAVGFDGVWSCKQSGAASGSGTWSVGPAGGAATLTGDTGGILVGSVCTITENPPPTAVAGDTSYLWTTVVDGSVTVPVDGATATVTNTLTRTDGRVTIAKNVTGGVPGTAFEDAAFTFGYVCTPQTGADITGTVSTRAAGSVSLPQDIPAGASCTITEQTGAALPTPIDPYRWSGVSFQVTGATATPQADGVSFTTPTDGSTVAVVATNTIEPRTGSVTVSKVVTDLDGGFVGGDRALFPLTLSCMMPGATVPTVLATNTIANGAGATWSDIPLGAKCTVGEGPIADGGLKDASFTWGAPAYSDPDGVTVAEGAAQTMTVTNAMKRMYAPIELVKVINDGGYTGVLDSTATFDGTWSCSYDGSVVASGTWKGTGSSAGTSASLQADRGSLTKIPLTASCGATETDPSAPSPDASYRWAEPKVAGIDSLASVGGTVTVTNALVRDTTEVKVKKVLAGATGGYAPAADFGGFSIAAFCALDPEDLGNADAANRMSASVDVQPGTDAVALITGVPQGWSCNVREAPASGQLLDQSYAWVSPATYAIGDTTLDGAFIPGRSGETVTVTNTIERLTGGLTVTKQYAGIPSAVVGNDAVFTGTYSCAYADGTANAATFTGTWSVAGAGKATLTPVPDLPYGTTCTTTEDNLDAADLADASWAWNAPQVTVTRSAVSADGPAAVTVTNSVHRVYAGLQVEKQYTGVDGAFAAGTTVSGGWSCLDGTTPAGSGRWSLPASGGSQIVATVADGVIPASATCTITEDTLDNALLTDASYAWNAPVFPDGASTAVQPGVVAEVTVQNSTKRVTGGFAITKQVERGVLVPDAVPNSALTYSGTYVCTYNGVPGAAKPWGPIPAGGTWVSPADEFVGASCAVTEGERGAPHPQDESFEWTAPMVSAPASITDDSTPEVTVTNRVERLTGTFGVTKLVTGDTSGIPAGPATYDFRWQCTAVDGTLFPAGGAGSFSVRAGGLWEGAGDVPAGSTCIVTEAGMPTPTDPSYTWTTKLAVTGATGTPDGNSVTFQVPADHTAVMVTATNTMARQQGTYTVTKSSNPGTGATVKPGDSIEYTVTVTPGQLGFVNDVVVTDTLTGVLDSADVDDASIVTSQGTASRTGTTLTWDVGRVAPGAALTMTYRVTVQADAWNKTLRNVVTATGENPPSDCSACETVQYTPAWELTKTADPASGAAVVAGDVITYTLKAHNPTGHAVMSGAVATDDVSGVVAFADLGALPDGVTRAGDTLTWAVPDLAPGADATVTYTATVKAGFDGVTIKNSATPGPGGTCAEGCETTHQTPKWTAAKSSDPDNGTAVQPGSTVTYTLTARNAGGVAVTDARVIDDMTEVLANASLVQPLADGLALTGNTLTWTVPELAVGAAATISYQVTVNDDARGVTIRNLITTDGPGGGCDPGACAVEHTVPAWTLAKSADPASGSEVSRGDTITYTLTAKNTGEGPLTGAIALDDLSKVLDHARLGTLPDGLTLDGTTLTWKIPDLAAGATATVSYQVTVNDDASDVTLTNTVKPDGTTGECAGSCVTEHPVPPVIEPTPSPSPTTTTPAPTTTPQPPLSVTGQPVLPRGVPVGAMLLVLLGLVLAARLRTRSEG